MKAYHAALLGLCLATFSRVLEVAFEFPAVVNFLHFPVICGLAAYALKHTRRFNIPLLSALAALLLTVVLSAVLSGAGLPNVVLDYPLVAEPFLLILALTNAGYTRRDVRSLGLGLLLLGLIQIPFVFYQWYMTRHTGDPDLIKGTMLDMGAGHHVVGAIVLVCGIHLLYNFRLRPFWLKYLLTSALVIIPVISDAKQVLLAFILSYALLALTKITKPATFLRYAAISLSLVALVHLAVETYYTDSYVNDLDFMSYGISDKFSAFDVIDSYLTSPVRWLFGAGPGHTIGRLGLMMSDYWDTLEPLGATKTPITDEVWKQSNWAAEFSSIFTPIFSWMGVLGDLGVVGLLLYFYILFFVYRRYCLDDVSRLLLLSIFVLGFIFSWSEEPNYMLYVSAVIVHRRLDHGVKRAGGARRESAVEKLSEAAMRYALSDEASPSSADVFKGGFAIIEPNRREGPDERRT